jgi:hypothetical protein
VSCLGTVLVFMAIGILCQRMGASFIAGQLLAAYLLGAVLALAASKVADLEGWPPSHKGPFLVSSVPVMLGTLLGLLEGLLTYLEVMDRNAPGWGRADLANYVYPSLSTYQHGVLAVTAGLGWYFTARACYRRRRRTQAM